MKEGEKIDKGEEGCPGRTRGWWCHILSKMDEEEMQTGVEIFGPTYLVITQTKICQD